MENLFFVNFLLLQIYRVRTNKLCLWFNLLNFRPMDE